MKPAAPPAEAEEAPAILLVPAREEAAAAPQPTETSAPSNRRGPSAVPIWGWIIVVVILIGGACGIVWAAVSPFLKVKMAVAVDAASLSRFDVDRDNVLGYSLALNLTLSNNRRWYTISFSKMEAAASYGGEEFARTELPDLILRKKRSFTLTALLQGRTQMTGGAPVAEKFGREQREGYHNVDVQVDMRLSSPRWERGSYTLRSFRGRATCPLKLPLAASVNGSRVTGFQRTECALRLFR